MKYKLVAVHNPFFNPTAAFAFEPRFCRWYWQAWLWGWWLLTINDAVTDVYIYKRTLHSL